METSARPLLKGGCMEEESWGVREGPGLALATGQAPSPPTPHISGRGDRATVSTLVGAAPWPVRTATGSLLKSV